MTKDEFIEWLLSKRVPLVVFPYRVVSCDCRDVNCKGWRLVPQADAARAPLRVFSDANPSD